MTSAIATSPSTTAPVYADASCGASTEARLLALIVYSQSNRLDAAETSVNLNAEQLEKLHEDVRRALEDAKAAKQDAGFWGDIADFLGSDLATIATAVAAVAAVVASGGAAAAIVAVVAAAASYGAEHADELGIPVEVAVAVAIVAGVAGFMCGDVTGAVQAGDAACDVANGVSQGAGIVSGAGKAGAGVAHGIQGSYERDAGYANADARHGVAMEELTSSDIDAAIDQLSSAFDQQNGAARLASNIQAQSVSTNYAILNNWGGAA